MSANDTLHTEDDVKVKVVSEWLRRHGFRPQDISLERGFELHFGRASLFVGSTRRATRRARCDYLVRAHDGRNLMIVEVKAASEPLDDAAREQGISYARALKRGGIAPFVVLTNGRTTQIYDSITGALLNGTTIPMDHQHVRNGFRVSADDISLRAEALQTLISLSPENLLAFCRQSVAHHMQLLRSDDLQSGKKYVPKLYVQRAHARQELLSKVSSPVTLVVGRPQVGKTNFLCRFVEDALINGEPFLFYPAISMSKGLLGTLAEDFQWSFNDDSSLVHVIQKLNALLPRAKQRLSIVIDGWNEARREIAADLNEQCKRLASGNIRFVVSMTNLASRRLLVDRANNTQFLADSSGIRRDAIPLLESEPSKVDSQASIVVLDTYSDDETQLAYDVYSREYGVTVPLVHTRTRDPFLLGGAMRQYCGTSLPPVLNEPTIIASNLNNKAERVGNLEKHSIFMMLTALGAEMFVTDAPVLETHALTAWRLPASAPITSPLFEAALLTRRDKGSVSAIDFYFDRERDFIIAEWVRQWPTSLLDRKLIREEIGLAMRTSAGTDALRWFFGQRSYSSHLETAAKMFDQFADARVKALLLSAIIKAFLETPTEVDWIRSSMEAGVRDTDNRVRLEAIKLMTVMTEEYHDVASQVSADPELIAALLSIDEEFPLTKGSAGQIVLDALRSVHWDTAGEDGVSDVAAVLVELTDADASAIRRAASKALGYVAPEVFCEKLCQRLGQRISNSCAEDLYCGVEEVTDNFEERYYGSICPGYMEVLRDDLKLKGQEFHDMSEMLVPIIRFYGAGRCERLVDLLAELRPANSDDEMPFPLALYDTDQVKFSFWGD